MTVQEPPAQPCAICGAPYAPWGFGLPPGPTLWACRDHRAEVEASAVRAGIVKATAVAAP